jgi:4-carboxymuconolactone decarboxylase
MTSPRVPPLPEGEWKGEVVRILEALPQGADAPLGSYNIFRTLARHPDLFRSWLPFGGYLLTGGELPHRDRELLILRTAVRCGSSYEWGQHVLIALRLGLDRETIHRVVDGPGAEGWADHEAALMRAVDELHESARLADDTWEALRRRYSDVQLIEVTMLVGQYHMVAFALNSLGVELDEGLEPLPPEVWEPGDP